MKNNLYSGIKPSFVLGFFLSVVIIITIFLGDNLVYGAERTYEDLWNAERNAYVISSNEDFLLFYNSLKDNKFENKVILLDKDIEVKPEARVAKTFKGYFNGQGHTIKGWNTTLFNLITGDGAALVNTNFTELDLSDNVIFVTNGAKATIQNCSFQGKRTISDQVANKQGYIVRNQKDSKVIKNCFFDIDYEIGSGDDIQVAGLALSNAGTIENCIYTGKITVPESASLVVGITNVGTVTNCYYIDTNNYTDGGLGTSCTEEELKDTSTYTGFDFDNIWDWDGVTNEGYPFLRSDIADEYLPTPPNLEEIPLTYQVSLEDVTYDTENNTFERYFPVAVSEPKYTGTNAEITEKSLKEILDTCKVEVRGKTSSELSEANRNNLEVVPREGYTVTLLTDDAGAFVYTDTGTAKENGYLLKITAEWAENGQTAEFIAGEVEATELTQEEKAEIVAQAETAMVKILDMYVEKYPGQYVGDPWFAFTCGRAGYYPEGITEEALYEAIVDARWRQYVEMSEEELAAVTFDMNTVSKDILAITAMGYDATNVEGLDLADILANHSSANGNYFAGQYQLYALYSGDYGSGYNTTADSLLSSYNWENLKNSYDTDDMVSMTLQPLFLATEGTDKEEHIQIVEDWLSRSQTLIGTFPGYNGFANPWTNAQVHILMGLLDMDWLSSDFVKNGENILSTLLDEGGIELSMTYAAERTQCAKGLAALVRSYKGETDLFDCSDVKGARYVNLEILNLAENPADNDQTAVQALWSVYDSLSDSKKAAVKDLQKLQNAKDYADREAAWQQEAEAFRQNVDALVQSGVSPEDEEAVNKLVQQLESLNIKGQELNLSVEEAYQMKLEELQTQIADQKEVRKVIEKINAVGEVTLESQEAIQGARDAYNALTAAQQKYVQDAGALTILETAEAALETLQKAAVQDVINNISQLEEGVYLEDEEFLITVRDMYDALPEDLKPQVTNYALLTESEGKMKSLKLDDLWSRVDSLPALEDLVTTDEEGNQVYVITQDTVTAAAQAQAAWEDMLRKYQGIEAEVKAMEGGPELLDKLSRVNEVVKEYEGYVETYLEPLVSYLMGTETVDDLNLAEVERRLTEYEEQMDSYSAYLNSVDGLAERAESLKAQAEALRTAKNEANAVQQLINNLPQESITSQEMLTQAQEALAEIDRASQELSETAKGYVDWTLYNTTLTNVELYLAKQEQAKAVTDSIAEALAAAEENLTDDSTVAAVKAAEEAYQALTADIQAMVEGADDLEAVKDEIAQKKNQEFAENGILTIKETLPYDVRVLVKTADSNTEEALEKLLLEDKEAQLYTAFTVEAYRILADGSTEPWELNLTAVYTAEDSVSGQNVFVLQMAEENAYLKNIAQDSTVTFTLDASGAYAIGLKEADSGEKEDPVPGDSNGSGTDNNNGNSGTNNGGSSTGNKTAGTSTTGGTNSSSGTSTTASGPKTGDSIPAETAAGLLLTAAAAVSLVLLNRKRKMN